MVFRKATKEEIPRIWEIILQAKAQMKRAGSEQWQDGYPTVEIIGNDIEQGIGFVICDKERVIAYGAVSFDSEPAYEEIAEKWQGSSYVVVHRLAVADECKHRGVAHAFFDYTEQYALQKGIGSFRVDTNFDNAYMLRLMKSCHFVYRGEVHYGIRGSRMAFERVMLNRVGREEEDGKDNACDK